MDPSISSAEIEKFSALAAQWWSPDGAFKPLHQMNAVRLAFIRDELLLESGQAEQPRYPLRGLQIADIGCGGGLLAEPLARMGAHLTGIDASEAAIVAARHHAEQMGLDITYQHMSAASLARTGQQFDAVTAMEIIEHVETGTREAFLADCATLLKPGGLFFVSTLNRTAQSYLLAILGAEYVLGLLPKGTHDWSTFPAPEELTQHLENAGLDVIGETGFVYNPLKGEWQSAPENLRVNYALLARKPLE